MNDKISYLWRKTFTFKGRNVVKSLIPTFIYIFFGIILAVGLSFLSASQMTRITYVVIGLTAAVWLYSSTILNYYEINRKDSIIKMNYIPIYLRVIPTIIFQTVIYLLFTIIYSAILSIKTTEFMLRIFSLGYYVLLGMILIIPFTIFYIELRQHFKYKYIDVLLFILLILLTPVFYISENLPSILENILVLNPFYYIVYGIELSAVKVSWSTNRIPNDILFLSEVTLIYMALYRLYTKSNIYMKKEKSH